MLDILLWAIEIAMIGGILLIELLEFKKEYMAEKPKKSNVVLAA